MELFQRIEMVLSLARMPKYVLAEKLGISQATLTRYFCLEQQDKLKMLLWDIALLFPDINREWLFFEEGKILKKDEELARQGQQKKEISRLQTQIFVEGPSDQDGRTATGKTGEGQG